MIHLLKKLTFPLISLLFITSSIEAELTILAPSNETISIRDSVLFLVKVDIDSTESHPVCFHVLDPNDNTNFLGSDCVLPLNDIATIHLFNIQSILLGLESSELSVIVKSNNEQDTVKFKLLIPPAQPSSIHIPKDRPADTQLIEFLPRFKELIANSETMCNCQESDTYGCEAIKNPNMSIFESPINPDVSSLLE